MFEDGLRFEADLVYHPQRPEWYRYLLAIWLVTIGFIVMFIIVSARTDSNYTTVVYSFVLLVVLIFLPVIIRVVEGRHLEVVGKLIIDEKQIMTNNNTFPFKDLELVSVSALRFKGQVFSSDDTPDSGENIITITQGLKKLEYAYILKDVWHMEKLIKLIPQLNASIHRELFVIDISGLEEILPNLSSDWRNHL